MAEVYLPAGVDKKVLYPGKGEIPLFVDGTRATFHFRTFLTDEEKTEIDDSKKLGEPFVLLYGKKFKLEVWEHMVETMRAGEISSFHCKAYQIKPYAVVSKSLRDLKKKKDGDLKEGEEHHHNCAYDAIHKGLGYKDLDNILRQDQDLIFEISLLSVELPGTYEQELWTLNADERMQKIPKLREEGNDLFKKGKHDEAANLYSQALGCLEQLCMREKPGDPEWKKLDDMKIPFLLNYAQCKLLNGEYYQVIKHTTDVLEKSPDNVKALYRRAKAHAAVWNPDEAVNDFQQAVKLDPTLTSCVKKELQKLQESSHQKLETDRSKWKNLFNA